MESQYKIDIAIGDAKFTAEGPEEAVTAAYERWLELVRDRRVQAPHGVHELDTEVHLDPEKASSALLERVFSRDEPNAISLKVLPQGDNRIADALILLLYGFLMLREEETVTAVRLNQSAAKSGIKLVRIDRPISARGEYITEAGQRKGKKYGLNNPGIRHAKILLKEILGK